MSTIGLTKYGVIALKYEEDMTVEEIAERLGTTPEHISRMIKEWEAEE